MKKWQSCYFSFATYCAIVVGVAFSIMNNAFACSVPVFRYALEAWTPAKYEMFVFHRGKMSDADVATFDAMRKNAEDGKGLVNISFTTVDVAEKMDERIQRIWDENKCDKLPHAVAIYPDSCDAFFTGTPTEDLPHKLADSPARTEIARRISNGESVIFVLLESGNENLDASAAALLKMELAGLQATVKLLKQDDEEEEAKPRRRHLNLPLKLSFSVLKLARKDANERVFIDLLMKTDKKLSADKPIVFPVFGRGRLLCALTDTTITPTSLAECVTFLSGACSCQVKELNPGVDLLMSVNWDELLEKAAEAIPMDLGRKQTTLPAAAAIIAATPQTNEIAQNANGPTVGEMANVTTPPVDMKQGVSNDKTMYLAIMVAILLVIVTGWWALRSGTA